MKRYILTCMMCLVAMICLAPGAIAFPTQAPPENTDYLFLSGSGYDAGTGFGNVINLLTLQNPAQSTSEAGAITPSGADETLGGQVKNTSKTYTVADLKNLYGINENNLGVVLNLSEPGNLGVVTLDFFSLDFYNSSGSLLGRTLTKDLPSADLVPIGGFGTGTEGMFIPYHNNGFLTTFFSDDTNILGGTGGLSQVTDGQENFSLIKGTAPPPPSVPEPITLVLLGLGLVSLVGARRFNK